jgi:hypothetical protein
MYRYSKLSKMTRKSKERVGIIKSQNGAVLWQSIAVKPFRKIHALDHGNSWYPFSGVLCEEE